MSKDCSSSQFDKTSHHPFFFFIYILHYPLIFLYTQLMYHMKRTKIEEYNKLQGPPDDRTPGLMYAVYSV